VGLTRSGSTWTQQGNKLVGFGAIGGSQQGSSVSLSADGNMALIGGRNDNGGVGAAWVWSRSGGVWTQDHKLTGSGAIGTSLQGASVCLAGDGNTAIIGGRGDTSDAGAAWIWTRSGDVWSAQPKLVGTGAAGSSQQGASVALSADGKTALVGGPFDNSRAGAAWIFSSPALPRRRAVKP